MAKGPKLKPIVVTPRQRTVMERIVRARSSDAGLVLRIKIVLGGADGMSNSAVIRQYEVGHEAVRLWRTRWQAQRGRFAEIESTEAVKDEAERMRDVDSAIRAVLSDEPRPGAPPRFSAEQVTQIIAVACEAPQASGRPISHWTPREIADEVMKREVVERISPQSVGRFLKHGPDQAPPQPLLADQQARRPSRPGGLQRPGRSRV